MSGDELDPEPPFAELPPAGGTGEAGRMSASPATDALTLDDAARTYGVSLSTLYRRLHRDELAGAYKVGGRKGLEWRIPSGALEALGYRPAQEPERAPEPPDVDTLTRAVRQLTEALAADRRQLMAATEDRASAEREREQARIDAARLEAQLEAARERTRDLEYELARARRRWWQRKPERANVDDSDS